MAEKEVEVKVGEYVFEVGHTDKIFFPDDGYTKLDMVEYYQKIAPYILPHMKGRAVTMLRMTDGIYGESFYHKEIPDYFPAWIKRAFLPKEGGVTHYVVCDDAATLVYLAGQACVTPHLWLSRVDKPRQPDMIIFDLDPSGEDFEMVRQAALSLGDLLTKLGLHPFVKTTGSRGVHVICPIARTSDFDEVRTFAEEAAKYFSGTDDEHLTVEQRKEKRKGRVFIDTLRNSYAQTAVAPYALRAKPGATVATPIDWDELKDKRLQPQSYNMSNIFKRLAQVKDPWADMWKVKPGSIVVPWKKLKSLASDK